MYTDILHAFYSVDINFDAASDERKENKQLIHLILTFGLLSDLQMFHSQRANCHTKAVTANAVCPE
jgi:hypothetical protein